jgi:hypothetical protein
LLIDLVAGNDAGLPVLSGVQGRPFAWLVALTMLATSLGWVLWARRPGGRVLLGQQAVAVLACLEMVRLSVLGWDFDEGWLAALVTVAAAGLALLLRRLRVSPAAAALGALAVLAWVYLAASGLVRAVLADGPGELFAGLDGGPLLVSGLLAGVVASLPRPHPAVRVVSAVFAVAGPAVVVLLPARGLTFTGMVLVLAGSAFALAVGGALARSPWSHALRVVGAGTALLPGSALVLGAVLALVRVLGSAGLAWSRPLSAPLEVDAFQPVLQAWAFAPVGGLVAAAFAVALVGRVRARSVVAAATAGAGVGLLISVLSTLWTLLEVGALLAIAAEVAVAVLVRTGSRIALAAAAVLVALGVAAALPSVGATALFLAVYGVLLVLAAVVTRGVTRAVLVALGVGSLAVCAEAVADLLDLSLPLTGLVLLAGAAVAVAAAQILAPRDDGPSWRRGLEAVSAVIAVAALVQTLDDSAVRTVAFGAAAVVTGGVVALVRDRRPLACLTLLLVAATAHQVVQLAGGAPPWRAVAVAAVAGLAALAAQRGRLRQTRSAVELTAVLTGVLAVAATAPDSRALTVALTCLGVCTLIVSLVSGDRRRVAWLGSVLLLAASWVRLHALDVDVIEAYTLPGSLALLVTGLLRMRRSPTATSWRALAMALAMGVTPSLGVALDHPTSLRALLVGLAGLGLVAVGARLGWGAPLVIGATAVGLLALVNVAPYAAALPRWVLFGTAGVALLALGVTWERRRQDLRLVHRYAARLR